MTCDFKQCGILTGLDSAEPVQPSFTTAQVAFLQNVFCDRFIKRCNCHQIKTRRPTIFVTSGKFLSVRSEIKDI